MQNTKPTVKFDCLGQNKPHRIYLEPGLCELITKVFDLSKSHQKQNARKKSKQAITEIEGYVIKFVSPFSTLKQQVVQSL